MSRSSSGRVWRLAEFVTLGVSTVLVAALIGYLVKSGLSGSDERLELTVRVDAQQAAPVGERFVVPVVVANQGERSVAAAKIKVQVGPESSAEQVDVGYLAAHSEKTIYLSVATDPRASPLQVMPFSYEIP